MGRLVELKGVEGPTVDPTQQFHNLSQTCHAMPCVTQIWSIIGVGGQGLMSTVTEHVT